MKTAAQIIGLMWLCGIMTAVATPRAKFTEPAPVLASNTMGALHTSRALVHGGFHHFPVHRPVVLLDGGFWWGYPYYGYPVGYHLESYEKVGKQWGKELRRGQVTIDQFVSFLQLDLLRASDRARSDFEVGFLKGYGKNALSLLTRALSEAKESQLSAATSRAPQATSQRSPEAPIRTTPLNAPKYQ